MSDAPEKVEIRRDRELEARLLEAVIADRNESPRNQQVAVGPSSIGFCRELLRAQLFEAVNNAGGMADAMTGETHWAAAAHVGTVMGEALEAIFGQRLSQVITQERVTTYFPKIGVEISGALDLAFIDENYITDLKSTTDIGGLLYSLNKNATIIETLLMIYREGRLFNWTVETPDGGYELTEKLLKTFSKLQYWIQVATYVTGAIQMGLLQYGAEGRLVFYDRAGDFQEFLAAVITAEEIEMFFELGQQRVWQVAQAQQFFEQTGNPHFIHQLRDQTPSFCFSPKVMCPMRERCWGGSEWEPEEVLDSADVSDSIDRYIEGRRLKKIGEGMTSAARAELKGIEGTTPDGRKVSWPGNSINVVETSKGAAIHRATGRTAVDMAQDAMARVAIDPQEAPEPKAESAFGPGPHTHKTKPGTKACAEGRCNPATIVADLEPEAPAAVAPVVPDLMGALRESVETKAAERAQRAGSPGELDVTYPVESEYAYEWEGEPEPPEPDYFDGSNAPVSHDWKGEPQASNSDPITSEVVAEPERDPRIDAVQFRDTDPRPLEVQPDYVVHADGAVTDSEGAVVAEFTPTPPEVVLATTPTLTDAQREFLERKAAASRSTPLPAGPELKAALEEDTSAARLRRAQQRVETTGQIARNREAARKPKP
jgi:hypothetical protein